MQIKPLKRLKLYEMYVKIKGVYKEQTENLIRKKKFECLSITVKNQ